ncbi:MAG: histidine phosphatase family protein [Acidimicrobiales bacterium]
MVILVRHGTTATTGRELPGRAPGLDLADQGRAEARVAAARIAAFTGRRNGNSTGRDGKQPPPPVLYASPLERTQQTAAPIAEALGCKVLTDDGLLEVDIGEWTGMELKAAQKRKEWAAIQRYPSSFRFPGGESFVDLQARMVSTLDRFRTTHPGHTVVAVSHADPIRVAVAQALGTHLDLFQRIAISPCSLTVVAYGADGPMVLTVNSTADGRESGPTPS